MDNTNGLTVNQIDHILILINSRFSNNILDVSSFRRTHSVTDHFLVVDKLKTSLKRNRCQKRTNTKEVFDVQKLNELAVKELSERPLVEKIKNQQRIRDCD